PLIAGFYRPRFHRYTSRPEQSLVYAVFLTWPKTDSLILGAPSATAGHSKVTLVGYSEPLRWQAMGKQGLLVTRPTFNLNQLPCQWGWALRLHNIA
uniref:Alpha-L-fucosidase C-terminal domain-containing protein n=1 Tax=Callorhinchus milii TaxID=7868 RepID=A0A4W3H2D9_CALMI